MKTSKKINAGDTLTVGDLTDDYLGAVIEVGPVDGITYRFSLSKIEQGFSDVVTLQTTEGGVKCAVWDRNVKVITPPPVVQPDAPTILGQCIRIEGLPEYEALVVDPSASFPFLYRYEGAVWHTRNWREIRDDAGDRQIIVSDPPRWPDETPEVPERIEAGEWPDDDMHLREWAWIDGDGDGGGDVWRWYEEYEYGPAGWRWFDEVITRTKPLCGPWTRGNRVEVKTGPKAGDVFTRIEDMPYGS